MNQEVKTLGGALNSEQQRVRQNFMIESVMDTIIMKKVN